MPKLTKTGYEIGSSEAGAIVLHKTSFQTRHEVLRRHKLARAGVEDIEQIRNPNALQRGTHLELGVANWAQERLVEMTSAHVQMEEPEEAFSKPDLGIASSVDRIIELHAPLHLDKSDGTVTSFNHVGIMEVKTDFYHQGKPKPEWVIQVLHQMLCTDLRWGIIACMDQSGKLHFYPVDWDENMVVLMIEAYAEFWELVKNDGEYPPIAQDPKPEFKDISDMLPQTNQDVAQLCGDYLKASAEERQWKKTKEDIRDAIETCLDALGVEYAALPGFEITSASVMKEKKKMVGTGEMAPSSKFAIKEISND